MAQLNGLPVYKIKIQDSLESNTGIDFISLVDFPAIEKNWVAFANEKSFHFNQDKQLLAGPILIPDMPIYRYSKEIGEYYVVFTKEEIVKLVRKFQSTQKALNLNYQHQKDSQVKTSVVQEIWITDKPDKSEKFGFDLPIGSAFVISHIGDVDFWNNEIKTGNVKGYSIEGFLNMELKNIKKMSQDKFVTATTTTGVVVESDGETFTVGAAVFTIENEQKVVLPDGNYAFDNGMGIDVVEGKITEVSAPEETPAVTEEEMAAIKNILKPIFEAYDAKIAELEVKLSNMVIPAKEDKQEEEKPEVVSKFSNARSVINKLNSLKTK